MNDAQRAVINEAVTENKRIRDYYAEALIEYRHNEYASRDIQTKLSNLDNLINQLEEVND